jgi:hypothetical protein
MTQPAPDKAILFPRIFRVKKEKKGHTARLAQRRIRPRQKEYRLSLLLHFGEVLVAGHSSQIFGWPLPSPRLSTAFGVGLVVWWC